MRNRPRLKTERKTIDIFICKILRKKVLTSFHLIADPSQFLSRTQKLEPPYRTQQATKRQNAAEQVSLNGHTLGFHPPTQNLEPLSTAKLTAPRENTAEMFSSWTSVFIRHLTSLATIQNFNHRLTKGTETADPLSLNLAIRPQTEKSRFCDRHVFREFKNGKYFPKCIVIS